MKSENSGELAPVQTTVFNADRGVSGASALPDLSATDDKASDSANKSSQSSDQSNPESLSESGDTLFVYTDGVPEAGNASQAFYGGERLLETLNRLRHGSLGELLHGVKADIDAFTGSAPQFDDITMLALTYLGPPAGPSLS